MRRLAALLAAGLFLAGDAALFAQLDLASPTA
jgi:hypothetical protein